MPIFEYRCGSCGQTEEHLVRRSDETPTHCSRCQGNLQKLMSASAFVLKGEGFYATDYNPLLTAMRQSDVPEERWQGPDMHGDPSPTNNPDNPLESSRGRKIQTEFHHHHDDDHH